MLSEHDIRCLELVSPRLVLREFRADDIPLIQSYWDDPTFRRFIHLRYKTAHDAWNSYFDEVESHQRKRYYFVIVENSTQSVIGAIRLDQLPADMMALNLHLELSPAFANKGYMTEAAGLLLKWAHTHLVFTYIQATVHPNNLASRRVVEKLGFQFIDYKQNYLRGSTGLPEDRLLYQLASPLTNPPSGVTPLTNDPA